MENGKTFWALARAVVRSHADLCPEEYETPLTNSDVTIPVTAYEKEFHAAQGDSYFVSNLGDRDRLVMKYAWAVPNAEALSCIAKYGPVVEGGAGGGYWAHLLRERGVDVVAYDIAPYCNIQVASRWTEVLTGSAEAMAQHKDRTLLLVWPPYDEPMALDHVKAHGGDVVIYVGEDMYGCTGDMAFHEHMAEHFEEIETVDLPQWGGIHDRLYVYRRK